MIKLPLESRGFIGSEVVIIKLELSQIYIRTKHNFCVPVSFGEKEKNTVFSCYVKIGTNDKL